MASGIFYPSVSADDGYRYPPSQFYSSFEYCVFGNAAGPANDSFFRFLNITIPQGSTITGAYIRLTSRYQGGDAVSIDIYGNDADDATALITYDSFDEVTKTTAKVDWDINAAWVEGTQYDSVSLISIIQEIVNRAGWSSGNALMLMLYNDAASSYKQGYAIDYDGGSAKAELHVTWSVPSTEVLKDLSTEIKASNLVISDLNSTIEAGLQTLIDLKVDLHTGKELLIDLKSHIAAEFLTNFADLSTETYARAQAFQDLLSEIKAGNLSITDLSSEIIAGVQVIADLSTYIRTIGCNFKDLTTAIEVIRCKHWLKTEIKAGCAARWYYTTEWNPNRFLKTSIEAKKPYEFSFSTITGATYAMQEAEVELLISGYSFPLRTLFLDYIKVGTANEYNFQIWWARGLSGKNSLKNVKIKAEYIDTQYPNGFEVVTCEWLSIKINDGEYQTVSGTPANLGDMPCDSKLNVTLKVNCRDCSLTRGLAFFKLIITGDWAESLYGGPAVYRDGACYHSGFYDDYSSDPFICRLYIVE